MSLCMIVSSKTMYILYKLMWPKASQAHVMILTITYQTHIMSNHQSSKPSNARATELRCALHYRFYLFIMKTRQPALIFPTS